MMGALATSAAASDAGAFDATLSIPGREELNQTNMRVRVVPAHPWIPPTISGKADEAGENTCEADSQARRDGAVLSWTNTRGDKRCGAKSAGDGESCGKKPKLSESFHLPPDAWSTPVTSSAFSEMTVIGFWEPGKGLDPLGALHLISGARGPRARIAADVWPREAVSRESGDSERGDVSAQRLVRSGVEALHHELRTKMKTAVISFAKGKREIHLCAVPTEAPSEDVDVPAPSEEVNAERALVRKRMENESSASVSFLAFETRAMAPFHYAPILSQKQLVVIFDLDETLLQACTLSALDRRAEAIRAARQNESGERWDAVRQTRDVSGAEEPTDAPGKTVFGALGSVHVGAHAVVDAREQRERREEDMARLKHDRAMLSQYVAENCVTDARGGRHVAVQESAVTAPGEVTFRPVIRLPSPHCKGGQMIFTRIDPANRGTSMIIHVRPGWEEMYLYLTGLDRRDAPGNPNTEPRARPTPRCAAFVCTMSESSYAQEMWRLLDPRGLLIAPRDLQHKVVCVKQGLELKTLDKAVGSTVSKELCVVLDDRTSVWEEKALSHILAVSPFMPYCTDSGPGLRRELPGEAGVLGAAKRMLEKTRMDVFMTYERFAKFHARFPNAPFEPPMRTLVSSVSETDAKPSIESRGTETTTPRGDAPRGDAPRGTTDDFEEGKEKESRRDGIKFSSSRPQPPDAGDALSPLMNAHAKEAARAVAQMGGAARSAAGAGSRLNAMLGGITAPRTAGAAFKTLVSSSFNKNAAAASVACRGDLSTKAPETAANDANREKAKAAAAAAMKFAAEEKERERLEREAERPDCDVVDPGDGEPSLGGVDSDEERLRKEDAYVEAALGDSADSDSDSSSDSSSSSSSGSDADADADADADSEPNEETKKASRKPGEPTARTSACKRTPSPETADDDEGRAREKQTRTRKIKNSCLKCTARGLRPTDHFRFCKSCPFHPEYKGKKKSDVRKEEPAQRERLPALEEREASELSSSSSSEGDYETEVIQISCVKCGRSDRYEHMVECSNRYHDKHSDPCLSNAHWQCLDLKLAPDEDHEWFCSKRCEKWHDAGERGLAVPETDDDADDAKCENGLKSKPRKEKGTARDDRSARAKRTAAVSDEADSDSDEKDSADAGEDDARDGSKDREPGGRKRRRDEPVRKESTRSPPPEVTAESEIPAKPSPSRPVSKKPKGSQKSQREAMLKKLSGKRSYK